MEINRISQLNEQADLIRKMSIECIANFGVGHIGGTSSVIETLTSLYYECANVDATRPDWADRDRIVLSKGHAAVALYATLAAKGYFHKSELLTLNKNGTNLPSHCDMLKVTGVDFTAGSLGQGISAAVGMAIAAKMDRKKYRVYAIVGDGESQEGQVWEAVMLAGSRKLNNLTVFVDNNGMQIDGMCDDICKVAPFEPKYKAFGFKVITVDGHDVEAIVNAIEESKKSKKPTAIILNTIKGKGIKCCEGTPGSHSVAFTDEILKAENTGGVLNI